LRTQIKRLLNDGNYEEALGEIEAAAGLPCARGWLDLQRYFVQACEQAGGYDYAKEAVLSELKALLADYPDLPKMSLLDDTPAANAETLAWLESLLPEKKQEQTRDWQEMEAAAPASEDSPDAGSAAEEKPRDAFELARAAVESGDHKQAIALLVREAAQERSGRARFQRQFQVAQICVASGHHAIAYPIMEGLAEEIQNRHLEGWEAPEMLAHVLSLLFRCADKLRDDPELKQKLYARVCRLDPLRALELGR
jgi:type VI secretion system protein ImpA